MTAISNPVSINHYSPDSGGVSYLQSLASHEREQLDAFYRSLVENPDFSREVQAKGLDPKKIIIDFQPGSGDYIINLRSKPTDPGLAISVPRGGPLGRFIQDKFPRNISHSALQRETVTTQRPAFGASQFTPPPQPQQVPQQTAFPRAFGAPQLQAQHQPPIVVPPGRAGAQQQPPEPRDDGHGGPARQDPPHDPRQNLGVHAGPHRRAQNADRRVRNDPAAHPLFRHHRRRAPLPIAPAVLQAAPLAEEEFVEAPEQNLALLRAEHEAAIAELRREIAALQLQVGAAQDATAERQRQIDDLIAQQREQDEENLATVEDLQAQIANAGHRIAAEIENAQSAERAYATVAQRLNATQAQAEINAQEAQRVIRDRTQWNVHFQDQIRQLEAELERLRPLAIEGSRVHALEALVQSLRERSEGLEAANALVARYQEEIRQLQNQQAAAHRDDQARIDKLNHQLAAAQGEIQTLTEQQQLHQLQEQLARLNEALEASEVQNQAFRQHLEIFTRAGDRREQALQQAQQETEQLRAQLEDRTNTLAALTAAHEKSAEQLAQAQALLTDQETRIQAGLAAQQSRRDETLEHAQRKLRKAQVDLQPLQHENEELRAQISRLQEELRKEQAPALRGQLRDARAELSRAVSLHDTQVREQLRFIESLQDERDQAVDGQREAREKIARMEEELQTLRVQLSAALLRAEDLEGSQGSKVLEIETLTALVAMQDRALAAQKDLEQALSAERATTAAQAAQLKQQEAIGRMFAKQSQRIAQLEAQIRAQSETENSTIAELRQTISDLEVKLTIKPAQDELDQAEKEIAIAERAQQDARTIDQQAHQIRDLQFTISDQAQKLKRAEEASRKASQARQSELEALERQIKEAAAVIPPGAQSAAAPSTEQPAEKILRELRRLQDMERAFLRQQQEYQLLRSECERLTQRCQTLERLNQQLQQQH